MKVHLLDVNVLIALFDPAHLDHHEAHRWFGTVGGKAWPTCPMTENGLVRILSNPGYPTVQATSAEVLDRLRIFCGRPGHHFWPADISMRDRSLFASDLPVGSRQISDVYLLALAVHHKGKLATFDRGIRAAAVPSGGVQALEVIGA